MTNTTNNVTGTQNNVWGSQYNASRDQYVNCTFIGVSDLPLTDAQRRQAFAIYVNIVRTDNASVKLIGAENISLPLAGLYVNLKAARRYDDAEVDHRVQEAVREYEEKLEKDECLSVVERFRLVDECRFWFRSGLQPQAEELPLDKAVITYSRLVILGEPGSGKTTLLRYLAHQFASVGVDDEIIAGFGYRRLPVLVKLPELVRYGFDPFAAVFASSVYTGNRDILIKLLREYAELGLVLFLFDGLDEVDSDKRGDVRNWLDRFARSLTPGNDRPQTAPLDQQVQGNRMIVTCRINSYFATALNHANAHNVIQPLKTGDHRTFLVAWYKAYEEQQGRQATKEVTEEWADGLAKKVDDPRYERLAEVPLLLSFLAYIKASKGELSSNRVTLYADMVEVMMKQRSTAMSDAVLEEIMLCLGRLAYCLNANNDAGTISQSAALRFFPERLQQHWRWLVETAGILTIRGSRVVISKLGKEKEESLYGFHHRTFEEYFAAIFLANLPEQKLLPTLRRHLHDIRWDEVILLTLGHIYFADNGKQRERAEQLLWQLCHAPMWEKYEYEDLFHRDLLFVLRISNDGIKLSGERLDMLADEVLKIYFETERTSINIPLSLLKLANPLDWDDPFIEDIRGKCRYKMLGQQIEVKLPMLSDSRSSKAAAPALLKLLNHKDSSVRVRAAAVIGQLGVKNEAVVTALLDLLCDSHINVRVSAARTVGQLGMKDERVNDALLGLLGDSDSNMRQRGVSTIEQLGVKDARLIAALLGLLDDLDSNVQLSAARTLGQLGVKDRRVIGALLKLLTDASWHVQVGAARELGQLGVKDAAIVAALLKLLGAAESYVRDIAADVLGELGVQDAAVVADLLSLLRDRDSNVRASAARTLGRLGVKDETVIDALLEILHDADRIDALLGMLHDADRIVRRSAARKLGELGVKDASVVAALWKLLGDTDSSVGASAAGALVQLGVKNKPVIDALGLSRNAGSNVRVSAARTLGQLGVKDGRVIGALLKLLTDASWNVQASAASALGQLGVKDERVIGALLGLLRDKDNLVWDIAASALGQVGVKDERVIRAMRGLMRGGYSGVRTKTAGVLGRLGAKNEHINGSMSDIMSGGYSKVRESAASALVQLGVKDERVIGALLDLLRGGDSNGDQAESAAKAIGQLHLNRGDVKQALYLLAKSSKKVGVYNAAYEALYTIISSQRSTAAEGICKGLLDEPTD